MSLRSQLSLVSELASLQELGQMCDTRLVGEDGSVALHWPLLGLRGVWWAGPRPSDKAVVILPGVTRCQLEAFVAELYIGHRPSSPPDLVPKIKFTVSKAKDEIKEDLSDNEHIEEDMPDLHSDFKGEGSDDEHDDNEDEDYDGSSGLTNDDTLRLIENDSYSELCDKLCQMYKAKYPACIKVDKERYLALLRSIRIKKLKEKYIAGDKRGQSKKIYSCSECGTEDVYLDKMMRHSLKHFKKPFYCDECNKFLSHVPGHLKTHSEEKKAKRINICEVCNKNFKSKYNLDVHSEHAHRTVHCDQCNFSCVGSANLRIHRTKKYSDQSGEKTKYPCHICG